jgi:GNAT superfamily N-acetyltransferase
VAANVDIRALAAERLGDYLSFFDTRAFTDNPRWAGCYCYFPYHDPNGAVPWQKRTAADNRAAMCDCISHGRAQGYLAYENGQVVGWCNAAPRPLYPMLNDPPDVAATEQGCIFCFVIAPTHRRRGIARALLDAACDGLKHQGLRTVQAQPSRRAAGEAQHYHGPLEMYLAAGFTIVREEQDGRVLVQKALR